MFTTRPEILGTFGVVTSTHWLATASGMAMLEKGGNAFDACAAAPRRPGRRYAGGVLFGADEEGRGALCPGAGAGRGDDQGL